VISHLCYYTIRAYYIKQNGPKNATISKTKSKYQLLFCRNIWDNWLSDDWI